MPTPYVTPEILRDAPTGMPWSTIPISRATTAAQAAEQANICWRATARVDGWCNQPLRCTLNAEQQSGPDYRITVDGSGVGRMITSRWPVLSVLGGRVAPRASFPRQWNVIPAAMIEPETPPIGNYGTIVEGASGAGDQAVLIAPSYVSWAAGRNGFVVEVEYLNGWPHAGLTEAAVPGDQTLAVDDVTGFTGAAAMVYDGGATESIIALSVTAVNPATLPSGAVVPVGPGTLQLATPLLAAHAAGVAVSSLPADVGQATILFAAAQVLDAGITSITIQSVNGGKQYGQGDRDALAKEAQEILTPYRRVI